MNAHAQRPEGEQREPPGRWSVKFDGPVFAIRPNWSLASPGLSAPHARSVDAGFDGPMRRTTAHQAATRPSRI
jgi:hypothetical protein